MANKPAQDVYEHITAVYDGIEALPHSHLTQALVKRALGDCTGQVILDLGGGSGLHARSAIQLGADRVDNVDLSPDMLRNCDDKEEAAGRRAGERVKCFVGDVTQPLDHLKLPGSQGSELYDTILVGWTFDHAATLDELEAMWQNTAKYCRRGGRVVSIRMADPWHLDPSTDKYGVEISNQEAIPGGVKYIYSPQTDPPFSCEASSLEANYDLRQASEMAARFGFDGLQLVSAAGLPLVEADLEYWQAYMDHPNFICVVGKKL